MVSARPGPHISNSARRPINGAWLRSRHVRRPVATRSSDDYDCLMRGSLKVIVASTLISGALAGSPSALEAASMSGLEQRGDETPTARVAHLRGAVNVTRLVAATGGGGRANTFAFTTSGRVLAWGSGDFGQLGDGKHYRSLGGARHAVFVMGLRNPRAIIGNGNSTFAILRGGGLMAWGYNYNGQLGVGDHRRRLTPVRVPGLRNVQTVVASGMNQTYVVAGGRVFAMGMNSCGELGLGDTKDRARPRAVAHLTHVRAVYTPDYQTAVAITRTGTVWSWGYGYYGQRGDGSRQQCRAEPHRVDIPGKVDRLYVEPPLEGTERVIAQLRNGDLWAWGKHGRGLGLAVSTNVFAPRKLTKVKNIERVYMSQYQSYARSGDGRVWGWGAPLVGDGTRQRRLTPVRLPSLDGAASIRPAGLNDVSFAKLGPTVQAWGFGDNGGFGLDSLADHTSPTEIPFLAGVSDLPASEPYAAIVDGEAWMWGVWYTQTGSGPFGPLSIEGLPRVTAVADPDAAWPFTGAFHTLFLGANGKVYSVVLH
jgi:alpha-tubulin suppressor-like RCC1 family protein